ncbi:hypothetical protein GCM10009797_25410 [Nocardioides hwasunensis]|uniref:Phosphotransferase n=2 Tax=Nocardioides hwasunensis TaxID=397258 RepID=A0ABR8MES8_9ACTN|nr:phosphotransferase [Nocardioides hwasunensis]
MTPLAGGWSGRTFLGDVGGERAVVRVYVPDDARGPAAAEIDRAVLDLVRGLVPVPEVLEARRSQPAQGQPGLLITTWVEGERGDLVVADLLDRSDRDGMARLGAAMGTVAATLAGMPVRRPGTFVDAELALGSLPDLGLDEWVGRHLHDWPLERRARLERLAAQAQDLLDSVARACLVHGDLNPKNVLLAPGATELAAVLDWEFAHAGHPWTDVGNLLRFERHPAYVEGVLEAWTDLRGGTPDALREGARAADLWALVELAARAGDNPVASRAAVLLQAVGDSGDMHAWPF